jgi:hypothetical protein
MVDIYIYLSTYATFKNLLITYKLLGGNLRLRNAFLWANHVMSHGN